MPIYYHEDGSEEEVHETQIEDFEVTYPKAVKTSTVPDQQIQHENYVDFSGTVAPKTDSTTRETSWFKMEEGWIPDEWQGIQRPDIKTPNLLTQADDIQHVSASDLQMVIGDEWHNKEEKGVEFLNNHYRSRENLDVRFIQTKAGYNQLKMVVGGEEINEPIELTGNTDWNDLQVNIQLKIDDHFGNKKVKQKNNQELLDKILSLDLPENILDFDPTGLNKAEFAHILDKAYNSDELNVRDGRWEETNIYGYDAYKKSALGSSSRIYEEEDLEKYGNRLGFEAEQNLAMGMKSSISEIVTVGGYDSAVADMNGGITLDDGTYVPYTYLWDKRKELQKIQSVTDDNMLWDKKVKTHGSEDKFYQYIADNAWIYLNEPEEKEIRDKHIRLKDIEDDDERKIIAGEINDLWKKLYPDLSNEDIDRLTLRNKEGEFIDIRKPEGEEDPLIEPNAEKLARDHDDKYIKRKRAEAYIRYINIQKRVSKNRKKIAEETNVIVKEVGGLFDFSNDALGKVVSQAEYVAADEDIFFGAPGEGLSNQPTPPTAGEGIPMYHGVLAPQEYLNTTMGELPGSSALAIENNDALRDFKTWSRAVDLNLNINQTSEENAFKEFVNNVTESFVGAKAFTEKDSDEARDAWVDVLKHDGYTVPEHVIESNFFRNGTLGKNSTTRKVVEGGGSIIADLGPLLLELRAFNAVGGMRRLNTLFGSKSKLVTRLTKNIENPAALFVTKNMIPQGLVTVAEWSIAESVGELATGGAWKAHTIDWERGETNFTMPFTMGMSGPAFGAFSQGAMKWFGNTRLGNAILPKLQNPESWLNATKGGARVKTLGTIPQAAGQGVVATTMLMVAETSQALIDKAIKQEDYALADRLKEITDPEHVISTWFAMTVLSGKDVAPRAREAFRTTIASFKTNKEVTAKAYKELGVNENNTTGEINVATQKRLDEVYENGLSIKETNAKVKEIKQMNKDLRMDKLIKSSRDAAIKDGKYYEDFVLPRWEVMRNLSTKPVNEWKATDYDQIKKLIMF